MQIVTFDITQATEEEIWAIWRGELQVDMTPEDEAMFYEYCGREIYAQHQRDYPNATYSIEIRRILPEDDPLGEGYFLEISRIQYEPEPIEPEPQYDDHYLIALKAFEKEQSAQPQKAEHYSDWWGVLNWFEGDKYYDATSYIQLHDELFGEKPLTYSAASQDLPF